MKQGEVWNIFFILISSVSTTHVKYAYKKVTSWYLYQGIIG